MNTNLGSSAYDLKMNLTLKAGDEKLDIEFELPDVTIFSGTTRSFPTYDEIWPSPQLSRVANTKRAPD